MTAGRTSSLAILVSSIALIMGGVVMNIMLVSVRERTREIGIRKAIGAVRRDIVTQFLIEAITPSAIGGVIGVAVGLAVAAVVSNISTLATATTLWSIVVGLMVSISIGLYFGNRTACLITLLLLSQSTPTKISDLARRSGA